MLRLLVNKTNNRILQSWRGFQIRNIKIKFSFLKPRRIRVLENSIT